jgi:ketosteroid isomerase-like protein
MKQFVILLVAIVPIAFTQNISAQQWSAEQQEVWKTIEELWALNEKGDLNGYLSQFDESYLGWNYNSDVPRDFSTITKRVEYSFQNRKILLYTIVPARIWVKDDFAFAHYYYTTVSKDNAGTVTNDAGRWTDIFMKKGNKWLCIGDHGGKTSK